MDTIRSRLERPEASRGRLPWLRIAAIAAVAEAVLVLVDVVPAGIAIGIAAGTVALYLAARSRLRWAPARTVLWSVAVSQALILFVPLLLAIAGWILVSAIAVAGAVLLLFLVLDRR